MWLKTAAHQLRKWVPTSSEYLTSKARAAGTALGAAQAEKERQAIGGAPLRAEVELGANPNYNGDQVFDADVVPDGVNPETGEIAGPVEPDQSYFDALNAEAAQH